MAMSHDYADAIPIPCHPIRGLNLAMYFRYTLKTEDTLARADTFLPAGIQIMTVFRFGCNSTVHY